ncbi:MAG: MASE3 domain-containing protein [Pseudomonadota bacterium]
MGINAVTGRLNRAMVVGAALVFVFYLTSLYNYLLFHSLVEIFSIIVACSIFLLVWNARQFLDNAYLLFIGIAYLFVGALDLLHTLAYKGMGVFQADAANLSTQLWITTRYIESISLLMAPFLLKRKLNHRFAFFAYFAVVTLVLLSIFYWHAFPDCFIEGKGLTPFKIVSEYIIVLTLGASVAFLFRRRPAFDKNVFGLLVASIAVTMLSEFAFTLYVDVYGFANMIGHFFKLISFYLIYEAIIATGLMKPYYVLFRNLKQSENALQKARDNLEQKVEERTAELAEINVQLRKEVEERRHAEEALRSAHKRLARRNRAMRILSAKLLRRQERDRQKLAMELHDQLGQMLTIIKMDVEMATQLVLPPNETLQQKMDRVKSAMSQAIREVKDICHRLRPSMLDTMGLVPSLRTLIDEIKNRGNMQCELYTSNTPPSFSPNIDIAIYRIAQESLTNIVKYAQAKNVFINLIVRDSTVSLSIEDDGIGFDADNMLKDAAMTGKSLGLLTMKERTTQLKGRFSIESRPGHGSHILVEIPLRAWRSAGGIATPDKPINQLK